MTRIVFGGAAVFVSEADIPEADLPRHPFTGEVLPRRDRMGVPQEIEVKVVEVKFN